MIVAVPLPFNMHCKKACPHERAVNGAPSERYSTGFTPGLREVFASAAAAFFHQPKALFGRACRGYLIPSKPIGVL